MSSRQTAHYVAATRVAQHDNTTRSLVMLHGIYGRGRNWLGIARSLVAARPEYACWLVDLPHHGSSGPGAHGDTVHGLAADVADWLAHAHVTPTAILGHSYGGKVALAMAAAAPDTPLQVWVIDSTPEVKPPSGSAYDMLRVIKDLPPRFHSREAAQAALVEHGYTVGVAQWMSTNLVRDGESFRWQLDFDAMERLLLDFFETDLWAVIEQPSPMHDIHILKAGESSAISPEAVRRIEAAAGRVRLHHAPGGHWIHAERPEVVTALLVQALH
ncbi:MAG: alpha/beta fold hydrolase [Vicinamibacterales bacterium]